MKKSNDKPFKKMLLYFFILILALAAIKVYQLLFSPSAAAAKANKNAIDLANAVNSVTAPSNSAFPAVVPQVQLVSDSNSLVQALNNNWNPGDQVFNVVANIMLSYAAPADLVNLYKQYGTQIMSVPFWYLWPGVSGTYDLKGALHQRFPAHSSTIDSVWFQNTGI